MYTGNKDYSKRTQEGYSLIFKLQLVDEVERAVSLTNNVKKSMHEINKI